jgi:hypothetical protein
MGKVTATGAVALLSTVMAATQYAPILLYQQRGDREEGLRTIPVAGGLQVELVSARIEGPASTSQPPTPASFTWAETVTVRFYLPEPDDAFLTVRQLRAQASYYWLTFPARREARLAGKWTAGATNEYAWPTSSVLARLPEIRLGDLGAVVRMGQQGATNLQRVLPAALFDREPIEVVDAYRFSLRPLSRVNVTAVILRDSTELQRRDSTVEDADSPMTVRWRPGTAPEGWYRLVVSAASGNQQARLDQEIRFYHQPVLRRAIRQGAP